MVDNYIKNEHKKRSVFRAIFVPLILIMVLQSAVFYITAVYGGVEDSLNQNAVDILSERMTNRKNELEASFNRTWTDFSAYETGLNEIYREYVQEYGDAPFELSTVHQIDYLSDSVDILITMLRRNQVNGVFLILNDRPQDYTPLPGDSKYGVCIRDFDQTGNYSGTEDLLIERSPSAIIEQLGCSLDSWWEARYTFESIEEGDYYYYPLKAALDNRGVKSDDLAYLSGAHAFNESAQEVISYSIPLIDENGNPYAVLGIELTTKYLSSLLPGRELSGSDSSCYVLGISSPDSGVCVPFASNGVLYNRSFSSGDVISLTDTSKYGGFNLTCRGNLQLYGVSCELTVYNNNNPFDNDRLTLVALSEGRSLFAYSKQIRRMLLRVTVLSLGLAVVGILAVSRRFSAPVTALAKRAQAMDPQSDLRLGYLGITEIDQLVDSLETLSRNVSREIARTEFFSRMSHDMRTPMNAIISFSSPEMLENADEARKDDFLGKIHSSGIYLLGLINEVLDITKIESNKVVLRFAPVPAGELWSTAIPIAGELASSKKIRFVTQLPESAGLKLIVDRQHLNQIILNLLSNAIKFTPSGGLVVFSVEFEHSGGDDNTVLCRIIVSDNGVGMSEEFQRRLYHPFEQENDGLEGTGLGLSICKKLVELMGGTISCNSRKHIGTVFCVEFPLQVAEKDAAEAKPPVSAAPAAEKAGDSLFGKRVLLCEDHPLNTQIARNLLERRGIKVENAVNGALGVELFSQSPCGYFDAILMDIRMPELDGLGAAAAIRALDRGDAATVPIIAMTANAFDEDVRKSSEAGMNAHLSKPIEPDLLYTTLSELINKNSPGGGINHE